MTAGPADWDWAAIAASLDRDGFALTPQALSAGECADLIALYDDDARFRRRIVMERHSFGAGSYGYFSEPLPPTVAALREALYAGLSPLANGAMERMRSGTRYPATLAEYRAICAAAGQTKPTPLLLRYEAGGYNRLHRDLYGELAFPFQATAMLSRPGEDFSGGHFLLVENRPRQQAIGAAVDIPQGCFILFPTNERPVLGARGYFKAGMRHGVSKVLSGERYTLGIIFHDAA
jgi:hypothetical protein